MLTNSNMKIFAFADEANALIDNQIKAMLRNNLSGLEIRNVDNCNVSDISINKAKEVKQKLDVNGLSVWSVGSPIGKIGIEDDFSNHLDKFKRTLEIAETLKAKNIRLFSFFIPNNSNPNDYKQEVIERLSMFVEAANGSDIILCHENEKGIYGDTPQRCLEIHKAIPEIRGVFDPANFIQCGQNTLVAYEVLKDYINYLHIKDALSDGSVVPAGMGEGNVKSILESFIKCGGRSITIEPHLSIFEGLDELEREGNTSNVGKYVYPSNDIAFDVACNATKQILEAIL